MERKEKKSSSTARNTKNSAKSSTIMKRSTSVVITKSTSHNTLSIKTSKIWPGTLTTKKLKTDVANKEQVFTQCKNLATEKAPKKCSKSQIDEKERQKQKMAKQKKEYKADVSRAKRAKYNSSSLTANHVLRDLKNSASRQMSNMKNSFENILSQKLHLTTPKEGHYKSCHDTGCTYYNELENEPRSPIPMYSPFGFESPHPQKHDSRIFNRRSRMKPPTRINEDLMFTSPTGKIRDDIRSITNSLNELTVISEGIHNKLSVFSASTSVDNR